MAKHQLRGFAVNPIDAVKMLAFAITVTWVHQCFHVSNGWEQGAAGGVCNYCHQRVVWIRLRRTTPIGFVNKGITFYATIFVNELHGANMTCLGNFELTRFVFRSSKADRALIDFLPNVFACGQHCLIRLLIWVDPQFLFVRNVCLTPLDFGARLGSKLLDCSQRHSVIWSFHVKPVYIWQKVLWSRFLYPFVQFANLVRDDEVVALTSLFLFTYLKAVKGTLNLNCSKRVTLEEHSKNWTLSRGTLACSFNSDVGQQEAHRRHWQPTVWFHFGCRSRET